MRFIAAVVSLTMLIAPNLALAQVTGPMYQIYLGGLPINCKNNNQVPVGIYLDSSLNNVGVATTDSSGAPIIVLNPNVVAMFSSIVQQWWFAHECAHHALGTYNSEPNADCFGAQQLVYFGILNNRAQLRAFANELSRLPGSLISGHLPGPERALRVANCAIGFG